jgi:hypothetical protein
MLAMNSVTQTCRPTRMASSVTAILLNAVNPVTYHPVLPMLTGAQAREWWVAAYNTDHLFRDPKLINRYQLTQRDDFWYYNNKLLVVPSLLRKQVLSQCHDALTSAHFGRTKTLNNIQRHFWWPAGIAGIRQHISKTVYLAQGTSQLSTSHTAHCPPCRCLIALGAQSLWTLSPIYL